MIGYSGILSTKSKYGLKALLVLAQEAGHGPVLVAELAAREGIPKKFLEAILLELNRHGVVQSKKGKGGGYFLRRKPADITFGDIIRVLDGPLAAVPCVSQTACAKCGECINEQSYGVRFAMKQVRDAIAQVLDNTTLADVNAQLPRKRHRIAGGSRARGHGRSDASELVPVLLLHGSTTGDTEFQVQLTFD